MLKGPPQTPRGALSGGAAAGPTIAAATAAFSADYGSAPFSPVTIVIAALNEVESVAGVVRAVPPEVCGRRTTCLVIDDGSTDGTAAAARAAGAVVCRLGCNLGQGRALRLGYRLATERGAEVLATLDADGQFVPGELAHLVEPIVEGRADFVNGSRRLGRSEHGDPIRRAGIVLFGWLVSRLGGTRITDPANGFRAFRSEVALAVPLRQPQYQTAELLLGALALGFRVVEVPVTVTARAAGASKKGSNLRYGYRFARVVVTTWWSLRRDRAG